MIGTTIGRWAPEQNSVHCELRIKRVLDVRLSHTARINRSVVAVVSSKKGRENAGLDWERSFGPQALRLVQIISSDLNWSGTWGQYTQSEEVWKVVSIISE